MVPTSNIDEILAKLREEDASLAHQEERCKAELRSIRGERKKLRSSIATLSPDKPAKEPLPEGKVKEAMVATLEQRAPLSRDLLCRAVVDHAKASGCSGTGVHLVVARLVRSAPFQEDEAGVRLAESA